VSASRLPNSQASSLTSKGFTRNEVIEKGEYFLDHMIASGAPISGSTGASGAAPKFLLREDAQGLFYADGALPDKETKKCWLVKFPRGKLSSDLEILKVENALFEVAKRSGLNAFGVCNWQENTLFLERFDRRIEDNGAVSYLGLESFYSAIGSVIFGEFKTHDEFLNLIANVSTSPLEDIAEYICRDVFNRMCRNTDNHGRNVSFLKTNGTIGLAPIYDVAPMAWDSEGIVRSTNWKDSSKEWLLMVKNLSEKKHLNKQKLRKCLEEKFFSLSRAWEYLCEFEDCESYLKRKIGSEEWNAPLLFAKSLLKEI
jgi:serine/threonine-protein kinase HipA